MGNKDNHTIIIVGYGMPNKELIKELLDNIQEMEIKVPQPTLLRLPSDSELSCDYDKFEEYKEKHKKPNYKKKNFWD